MGDKSQDNSSKMFSGPQNSIYSFSDPKLLSQSILIHKLLCESNNLNQMLFNKSANLHLLNKNIGFKSVEDRYRGDQN